MRTFQLDHSFKNQIRKKPVRWGFPSGPNFLGEIVFHRTYSRWLHEYNRNEVWDDVITRVINGTFRLMEEHIRDNNIYWEDWHAQKIAQEMYQQIREMKFLPPGRGLWCMGTAVTEERGLYAATNNCAFLSTKNLKVDLHRPFCILMDMSMLGVGVGFDTYGSLEIKRPKKKKITFTIPDTREGWVLSLEKLLLSYFNGTETVEFDYSKIRRQGLPLRCFGGLSSGPKPLMELHARIKELLARVKVIRDLEITDIMNMIGCCVVAGNVRRTAEMAIGGANIVEFKDYEKYIYRKDWGWASNNSELGCSGHIDYSRMIPYIKKNGEPGIIWLNNIQQYGRMNGKIDNRDYRAEGCNPCGEQSLEPYELCCLVENFPFHASNGQDFARTIKNSYLYAKTITLGMTPWPETNRVMLRNRRIGCSLSGLQQFIAVHGIAHTKDWLHRAYDEIQHWDRIYSDWFCVPKSIKTTSIKPSGTVSLLAGATPGGQWPIANFGIKNLRVAANSPWIKVFASAGYEVEPSVTDNSSAVVSIPYRSSYPVREESEVSMWEQLEMAAFLQKEWSDNQVSCTVTFNQDDDIAAALQYYQYRLKAISFLPRLTDVYPQMPYVKINESDYHRMSEKLKVIDFKGLRPEEEDAFCTTSSCEIKHARK